MENYRVRIRPLSAFGTPLYGDTLFGQLCWAVRNRLGEAELDNLLQGYTKGEPYAVISNAFPTGYVPCPDLPTRFFDEVPDTQRKAMKKKTWFPLEKADMPLAGWQRQSTDGHGAGLSEKQVLQPHNSIDRRTGTTNSAGFAPYGMNQIWYEDSVRLDLYLLLDESRLSADSARELLQDMGSLGFGRDASIGLGKFQVEHFEPVSLPRQPGANAYLSLAPCAPQGLNYDERRSYYQLFTRFGRHGDQAACQTGQPFKNPLLLARAGAVFSTDGSPGWIGQGLGGDGRLSRTIAATVHQGYAPVIAIHLPEQEEQAA